MDFHRPCVVISAARCDFHNRSTGIYIWRGRHNAASQHLKEAQNSSLVLVFCYRVRKALLKHGHDQVKALGDSLEEKANTTPPIVASDELGAKYTRLEIYEALSLPENKRGGDWLNGYHRHEDDWYIFANGGGGGGGYSGGAGAQGLADISRAGGGGGSFNGGTNQVNQSGEGTGHGTLTIEWAE